MYLREKDIAVYHRKKFEKGLIDLELIDFKTPYGSPYGYATIRELEKLEE